MKYCLLCDTEYLDHVTHCADDGEPLVDQETFERLRASTEPLAGPLRVLRVLEGPFHAHTVRDVLEQEGIPHSIHSHVDTAYSRIFLPGKGWGTALVLAQDFDRADTAVRQVMEAVLSQTNGDLETGSETEE